MLPALAILRDEAELALGATRVEDQQKSRVSANHVCRIITGADDMKLNEWDECGEMVEQNLWYGKMGETQRKTYPNPVLTTTKPTWRG